MMRHRFGSRRTSPFPDENEIHPGSLNNLPAGRTGIVSQLDGDKELVNRIISLGFTVGARVTVLNNQGHGPIVVSILGTHLALGRREADLVRVEPL